jgi:hypothetical protein
MSSWVTARVQRVIKQLKFFFLYTLKSEIGSFSGACLKERLAALGHIKIFLCSFGVEEIFVYMKSWNNLT